MTDTDARIFGYEWEDIQVAQQGNSAALHPPIDTSTPVVKPEVTERDKVLFVLHGLDGLEEQQLYGVIDRLRTSGIIDDGYNDDHYNDDPAPNTREF